MLRSGVFSSEVEEDAEDESSSLRLKLLHTSVWEGVEGEKSHHKHQKNAKH